MKLHSKLKTGHTFGVRAADTPLGATASAAPPLGRTFHIETLGCKVNQYESEQIATLLRGRGWSQVDLAASAALRVINSCSVTIQAASKSRQTTRRMTRLPLLAAPVMLEAGKEYTVAVERHAARERPRVIVTGCWATSDKVDVAAVEGVDAVLGHHQDVASELNALLDQWEAVDRLTTVSSQAAGEPLVAGTISLPQLDQHQSGHQRAFLKIQDGCDAHCTYCIIPQLRPALWSRPVDDAVAEAQRLVDSGHMEIVLTGIFLGAYGQPTALHRRQEQGRTPLAGLIEALCTRVPGLKRLRLSSLEPGDLTADLLSVLRTHRQIAPHFHLPLQSGSDAILHRMNRQYGRDDFLRMIDQIRAAFDRPALTTDIIVGFPGETDEEFQQTLDVVDAARFIHIHAFSYSPRPRTAAARWQRDFVRGPVVNQRIEILRQRTAVHSLAFRQTFLGQTLDIMVERPGAGDGLDDYCKAEGDDSSPSFQHGRCTRYFAIHFPCDRPRTGQLLRVKLDRVTAHRSIGHIIER